MLDDRMPGDSLTVTYATADFANKNAGRNKEVTVGGITISGPDAGNYILSCDSATATAGILPAILIVTGITAADKVYDGTTAATLDVTGAELAGAVPGDDVTLATSDAVGVFADKNVGMG